jgi:exonuclease III
MEYWKLKYLDGDRRHRAVGHLKRLRRFLDAHLPRRTAQGTLVLGTWNIRNFDNNRFGNGPRLEETFFYLAEVISRFDALAVQEVCRNLRPMERLMSILGPEYDFILTDVTEGRSGNEERLGFIYHRDKVAFQGVAGEIVLPEKLLISDVTRKRQFARTPFACAFQSGWLSFTFATVHIYFGSASKTSDAYQRRIKEIDAVARFLAKRSRAENRAYVLVGDFNIEKPGDATADALEQAGFTIVRNKEGSNRTRTKFYDQISFCARQGDVRLAQSERASGVLKLFDVLFRDEDFDAYQGEVDATLADKIADLEAEAQVVQARRPSASRTKTLAKLAKKLAEIRELRADAGRCRSYYLDEWRTFQLSDHLPLWVELDVDFADEYLDNL